MVAPDPLRSVPGPSTPAPPPRVPADGSTGAVPRETTGRPSYFPSGFAWLFVGVGRRWRGVVAALLATWYGLPLAIFLAAFCAVVFGVVGVIGGGVAGLRWVPAEVAQVPLLGSAVDALLPAAGGVIGGLIGVLLGLLLGFFGGLLLLWWTGAGDDPLASVGSLAGVAAIGLLVGLVYTLYRTTFERSILRANGARRMSRREQRLIVPIVRACARQLGLPDHPPILINDSPEVTATAYSRYLVIHRGLLEEFDYDPEVIAAVLCHELVHWRNGDPLAAMFIRGVALPLYAVYLALGWLARRADRGVGAALTTAPLTVLMWAIFWPVVVVVRWVVVPMQSAEVRRAEFRADQGAQRAGHRDGLRRVLVRLPESFETGYNGWDEAIATAAHPPNELRLERLEDAHESYPLPDPERPTWE